MQVLHKQRIGLTGTSCKSAMAVIELSVPVWGWEGGGVSSRNSRGGSYGFGGPAFAAPGMAYTKCLYHPEKYIRKSSTD